MRSFLALGISVLSIFTLIESRKLKLNDTTPAGIKTFLFRNNILYINQDSQRQDVAYITCSLPDWFNLSSVPAGNVTYEWYEPSVEKPKIGQVLEIKNTKLSGDYKCKVKDSKDKKMIDGWEETTLKIFNAYLSKQQQTPVEININQDTFVNYTADSKSQDKEIYLECRCPRCSVKDSFNWMLDGNNITADVKKHRSFNGTQSEGLLLGNPSFYDVGVYVCQSTMQPVSLGWISIRGDPVFAKGAKGSDNKLEGEAVTITNELYGNPIESFEWKRRVEDDGPPESAESINFWSAKEDKVKKSKIDEFASKNPGLVKRIKYYPTLDAPNAEIEITDLEKVDRATFIAEAVGANGKNATFETLVRVKGKLDALWPFLGIVAEVIILVAIIFIYERRRAKQESESDQETPDQKKPLTSTNNDNLRQRKA